MTWRERIAAGLACGYFAAVAGLALGMRFVGERWWVTGVALYLPRALYAAPFPIVAVSALALRRRPFYWAPTLAALLLLVPLTGFVPPQLTVRASGAPTLRLLSYNVDSAKDRAGDVIAEIDRYSADVVLLQEMGSDSITGALRERYPNVNTLGQFLIASRYPILSTKDPDKLDYLGRFRSLRYVQQVLDTPIGRLAIYNVHPISPREAFYEIRGGGSRRYFLLRGIFAALFSSQANANFEANSGLRTLQVRSFAESARQETDPVIIAGDTNLPGLSWIFGRYLSDYDDGFSVAGSGFGYTFPATGERDRTTRMFGGRPWMRIDRVLASHGLRFLRFEVGTSTASDHRCVVADLQRRSP
jgi:endonuclease/exonuclease/phosphatase (EEP) superfamily protein YafD